MRTKLLITAGCLAFAAILTWAVIAQNAWANRCRDAGGTVEERFEGFMTIIINGQPHLQPQYSDHCWINGHEASV